MLDKKIDAETKVHKASEQAIYFFSTLHKLRTMQLDEKRINRNLIKKIRKRMSSQSSAGNGSHRKGGSQSSLGSVTLNRNNSQSSFGNGSQRSLNSMYSVIGVEDDETVSTIGSRGSRGSRGSKSSIGRTRMIV